MKKTKDIQDLKIDGDGLVQGKLADPSNFEYDPVIVRFNFSLAPLHTKKN